MVIIKDFYSSIQILVIMKKNNFGCLMKTIHNKYLKLSRFNANKIDKTDHRKYTPTINLNHPIYLVLS